MVKLNTTILQSMLANQSFQVENFVLFVGLCLRTLVFNVVPNIVQVNVYKPTRIQGNLKDL
jgi:hypothetical protein